MHQSSDDDRTLLISIQKADTLLTGVEAFSFIYFLRLVKTTFSLLSLSGNKALKIYEWISSLHRVKKRVNEQKTNVKKTPNFHSISANNIIEEDQLS